MSLEPTTHNYLQGISHSTRWLLGELRPWWLVVETLLSKYVARTGNHVSHAYTDYVSPPARELYRWLCSRNREEKSSTS